MTATNRLNLLLSDILETKPPLNSENSQTSSSLLTFAEHDYHSSSILPSVKETLLPPRRNASSLKHHRQRHHINQSDIQNQQQQQQQQTQPLLNSSTLDDLFRALTLECEQYLANSSTSSYQNKTYDPFIVKPSTNIDSNDDDYENLHSSKSPLSNGRSSLKTSIQVTSPEKRQVISINVSSKKSSPPTVSSSQTYPLLSISHTTPSMNPLKIYQSSEEDSIDISSTNTTRKRRRRTRKQQILSSITHSSSSDDEHIETTNGSINDKKSTIPKRSCSTDYRQQRIHSIYDNHPISSLSSQKFPTRRIRRRDISLQQQHIPDSIKYSENNSLNFKENLCSPLSVLLTSTRPTSDFLDRSLQQRRSRLELVNHQPLTLLDRMHQQFYRTSPNHHNNNNNNIPTHRIASYPVY